MKKVTLLMLVGLLISNISFGQDVFTTDFPNGSNKMVRVLAINGKVTVKSHDGSGLEVKLTEGDWNNPSNDERAQGLKMISSVGEDNTNIGLFKAIEGNAIVLTQIGKHSREYEILVPKGCSVQLEDTGWMGCDFVVKGIDGELEVTAKNGGIVLQDISGPVVANALNGDIDLVFAEVSQASPTSIHATNGAIDITLPASTKANFNMSSMNGEIFSNLDLEITRKGNGWGSGTALAGSLNGGGVKIGLRAMNGNIFLRKK